jgi:hypothetical protein
MNQHEYYSLSAEGRARIAAQQNIAGQGLQIISAPMGEKSGMTKKQILDTIKLLSALEAWSFAEKHRLPDYLLEDLDKVVEVLSAEVLE